MIYKILAFKELELGNTLAFCLDKLLIIFFFFTLIILFILIILKSIG